MLGETKFKDLKSGMFFYWVFDDEKSYKIAEIKTESKPYFDGKDWRIKINGWLLPDLHLCSLGILDVPYGRTIKYSDMPQKIFKKLKHAKRYISWLSNEPKWIENKKLYLDLLKYCGTLSLSGNYNEQEEGMAFDSSYDNKIVAIGETGESYEFKI